MKRLIAVSAVLTITILGCVFIAAGQDGPSSVGSDTVARPRRAPASTSGPAPGSDTTPAPSSGQDLPKIPSKLSERNRGDASAPGATFTSDSSLVTVDVGVVDNKNNFLPGIPRNCFRILEDNVPQTVKEFSLGEAPMAIGMIVEFSNKFQWYGSLAWAQTLQFADAFLHTMKKDDYVALIRYDLNTHIVQDFTNDPAQLEAGLRSFGFPDFSEANLFDALTDTADRMSKIEGRRAILILTSGVDTFSKLTYDQTRRKLQDSGVPIYSIGLLQFQRAMTEGGGGMASAMNDLTFLQADNEMKTFAKESGGQAYFPRFPAELNDVFASMQQAMRNQYTLAYSPSNQQHDGKFRKITVQLVNPATNEPLVLKDDKNKVIKYTIIAKTGYKAPNEVE